MTMDAYEAILKNIARFIQLSDEERDAFVNILQVTNLRKKELAVQPGFVCRYKSYVFRGAMRSYFVDISGQEHTVALAVEDWWISDFYSYIYQTPATLHVEALEEAVLVQIEYHAEEQLLERFPIFERFFRIFAQRALAHLQRRMLSNLSMTAMERYEEYVEKYPAIATRVPQYALASFLGITTEFLSKIRNGKVKRLN